MMHTADIILTALLWGVGGAILAWFGTWPVRRRSQLGVLISVSIVATVASVAAVFGNVRAMLLEDNSALATVVAALVAGVMSALTAAFSARTFARDSKSLHAAVDALRQGRVPDSDGRRLSGELNRLHAELATTARTLAESRSREQSLEASRRELVAWVSHDLRTPLAGLRAMAEALEDGVAASPERYRPGA